MIRCVILSPCVIRCVILSHVLYGRLSSIPWFMTRDAFNILAVEGKTSGKNARTQRYVRWRGSSIDDCNLNFNFTPFLTRVKKLAILSVTSGVLLSYNLRSTADVVLAKYLPPKFVIGSRAVAISRRSENIYLRTFIATRLELEDVNIRHKCQQTAYVNNCYQ